MKRSKEYYINLYKRNLRENKWDIGLEIMNLSLCVFLYIACFMLMYSGYMSNDISISATVVSIIVFSALGVLFTVIIIRLAKLIIKRKELKYKIYTAENDGIITSTLENEYNEDNNGDSME